MYGLKFRNELPAAVVRELDSFLSWFSNWAGTAHDEEGELVDEKLTWLEGPWIIGGPEAFNDDAYLRLPYAIPCGTYNNYSVEGLESAVVVSLGATAGTGTEVILTGLAQPAGTKRRLLLFRNEDNSTAFILRHENAGSLEQNRFRLPGGSDLTINTNESVWLLYDTKWLRWSKAG